MQRINLRAPAIARRPAGQKTAKPSPFVSLKSHPRFPNFDGLLAPGSTQGWITPPCSLTTTGGWWKSNSRNKYGGVASVMARQQKIQSKPVLAFYWSWEEPRIRCRFELRVVKKRFIEIRIPPQTLSMHDLSMERGSILEPFRTVWASATAPRLPAPNGIMKSVDRHGNRDSRLPYALSSCHRAAWAALDFHFQKKSAHQSNVDSRLPVFHFKLSYRHHGTSDFFKPANSILLEV